MLSSSVVQPLRVDQVALVEQDDIAVAKLIARSLALEQVKAEAAGVRDRDDGIDPCQIAELGAQECQHHGQGIGKPGGFDH